MKISRTINGEAVEIELTRDELYFAYLEQEHEFDRGDVDMELDKYEYDGADGAADFLEHYGITVERARQNIDRIAYEKRRNINKYDMEWQDATQEGVRKIAEQIKDEEAS